MSNQMRLYSDGYKIVYRMLREDSNGHSYTEGSYFPEEEDKWKRLKTQIKSEFINPEKKTMKISFEFDFSNEDSVGVLFSFCFPWSYQKNRSFLSHLESRKPKDVYFHKETLTLSKEQRKLDLVTISDHTNITNMREIPLKHLFPECKTTPRCLAFSKDKLIVFISARVHPGETPSSFLMNGILKFLISDDPRAKILRKHFVFKLIPIINVDGVYRGHYRYDTNCLNMNRHYENPQLKLQPEIFAIVRLFLHYAREYKVKYYFDLHAHVQSKGLFVFGNSLDFLKQVENCLVPKLVELNCEYLNYDNCIFSEKSMKTKEKGDMNSKLGTGRVYFNRTSDITHAYTVEASYFRTTNVNTLSSLTPSNDRDIQKTLKLIHYPDTNLTDQNFFEKRHVKQDLDNNLFSPASYEKMGISLLISILDYEGLNPFSRVFNSEYGNIYNLRQFVSNKLVKEDEKYKRALINHTLSKDINSFKKGTSLYEKFMAHLSNNNQNTNDTASQTKRVSENSSRRNIFTTTTNNNEIKVNKEEKGTKFPEIKKSTREKNDMLTESDYTLKAVRVEKIQFSVKSLNNLKLLRRDTLYSYKNTEEANQFKAGGYSGKMKMMRGNVFDKLRKDSLKIKSTSYRNNIAFDFNK